MLHYAVKVITCHTADETDDTNELTFSEKILETRLKKETADEPRHLTAHKRLQHNTIIAHCI